MNHIQLRDGDRLFKRVSKVEARKVFNEGKPLTLCPSKLHPFGGFRPSVMIDSKGWSAYSFEEVVQNFSWYNCSWEAGYYVAFYVEVTK